MISGGTGTGAPETVGAPDGRGSTADSAAFLARALDRDLDIAVITIPAPVASPEDLLGSDGPGLFWTTPGSPVHVGLGIAHTVTGSGADRFRAMREDAERLWPRLTVSTHPDAAHLSPRLFGGFSFLPGPSSARWEGFGEAMFVLPRLLYTLDGGAATLSVTVPAGELERRGAEAVIAEVEEVLDRLGRGSGNGSGPDAAAVAGDTSAEADQTAGAAARGEWAEAVSSIQDRIAAGRADKIVAARSRAIPVPGGGDLPRMLRRMALESETAARFAFRFGSAVFAGATPERLIGRTGREVRTEALAGSVAADTPEREARLLASLKEEVEHEYVVRAIVDALAPLCERLDHPVEPRVQRLRHVLHLQTPFEGRLDRDVHVLELVERLHPTPAVGGWPTAEALAWIDDEEPGSRGWYAAPVGWFDRRGDGEFGVALRSALLRDDLAYLFAGAGIVGDSDANAEFDETEVKLRTMLDALGLLS